MASALAILNPDELAPWLDAWDRLAVARALPYAAPAWMLAWWRHAASATSRLAVVVVHEDGRLIGVAPWHEDRTRTGLRVARLLGTGHRVEPLAEPGREPEVAREVAACLASLADGPGALSLDRVDARSPWPLLLARESPGGGRVADRELTPAPVVRLEGTSFEAWLASRSRNFRDQRAQARRRIDRTGGVIRLVDQPAEVDAAIEAFVGITADRWANGAWGGPPRGGGVGAMLREAAAEMVPAGRMRIWKLDVDGETASVQVFLAADGELAYWNGGFDDRWSRLRPGFETIVRAIEHAFAQGDRRLDLGGGAMAYKRRLADDDEPLASAMVLPGGGPRRALHEAQLLPRQLDRLAVRAARRLPDGVTERLRRLRR